MIHGILIQMNFGLSILENFQRVAFPHFSKGSIVSCHYFKSYFGLETKIPRSVKTCTSEKTNEKNRNGQSLSLFLLCFWRVYYFWNSYEEKCERK